MLLGWWGLRGRRLRLAFLAVMSYVFYAYWDWRFLGLMWLSTGIDYVAARMIVAPTTATGPREIYLVVGAHGEPRAARRTSSTPASSSTR